MDELIAELLATIKVSGLEKMAADLNRAAQTLRKLSNQTNQQLGKQEKRFRTWSSRINQYVKTNQATLRSMGRYLAVVGAALTALVTKSGQLFVRYEKGASDISTLLSGGLTEISGQMEIFDQGIKRLSVSFDQTTASLQKGLYDILSASVAPAEALELLAVASQAASAGLTSVEVSADALTTILNAYQLEASQAGEVSDKLWAIVKRGKVTYEELAGSIGLAASTAAVAGLRFEELGALIATSTRAGVTNRIAMTGARSTLLAFLKNTDEQKEAARKFGFELNEVTLAAEGMEGVIRKLAGANDLNRAATAAEIVEIFQNRRALNVLAPVLQNVAGFIEDIALLNDSAGLSALAFSKRADDLGFQLGQLGKRLNILMIEFFEPLVPLIRGITEAIGDLIKWFGNLSAGTKGIIATITLLSGILLTLAGTLAFLLPGLIALGGVLSGPVVVGIAAVVAILVGAGGLIASLSKARAELAEAEKKTVEFTAALEQAQVTYERQVKTLDELVSQYQELREKLAGLADAQDPAAVEKRAKAEKELGDVISRILEIVPEARGELDAYGNVISIDTQIVNEFTEAQKRAYIEILKFAALESEIRARNLLKRREERDKEISDIQTKIEKYKALLKDVQDYAEEVRSKGPLQVEDFEDTLIGLKKDSDDYRDIINNLQTELAVLTKESKEYQSAVNALARALVILNKTGEITDTALQDQLDTIPGLTAAYNKLQSDGIERVKDSLNILEEAFGRIKEKFPDFRAYIDDARNASRETFNWGEVTKRIGDEMAILEDELKELYDAKRIQEFFDKQVEWLELLKRQNNAIAKQGDEIDGLAKTIDETAQRFIDFEGFSIQSLITYLELQQSKFAQGSNDWLAYEQLKVKYTDEAAAQIIRIWGQVTVDFKSGLSEMLQASFRGIDDLKDAWEGFKTSMVASVSKAFADSLIEKAGFDNIFKGNILGLEGILGGFGATISKTFSGIFGAGAGAAPGLTGIVTEAEAATLGITQLGKVTTITGESLLAFPKTSGLSQITLEATETTAALEGTGTWLQSIKGFLKSIATPLLIGAAAIGVMTTGVSRLAAGLHRGEESLQNFTAGLGNVASPITTLLPDMGKLDELLSSIAGGFAIFGPAGAIVAGGLNLAESLGVVKHGKGWEENLADHIQETLDTGKTEGIVRFFFETLFEEAIDGAGEGASVQLDKILGSGLDTRLAWYKRYIEGLGLFNDEQLAMFRDLLQLYDTEGERQQAAIRSNLLIANEQFRKFLDEIFAETPHLLDEVEGWAEIFSTAWKKAIDQGVTDVEGFRAIFEQILLSMEGLSQRTVDLLLEVFDQSKTAFDLTDEAGVASGQIWEKWTNQIAQNLQDVGGDIDKFIGDVEGVVAHAIDKFGELEGIEFLQLRDDLFEWLRQIPGMTDEMAAQFRDAIIENYDLYREMGFDLGKVFEDGLTKAIADPDLAKKLEAELVDVDAWETFRRMAREGGIALGDLHDDTTLINKALIEFQNELKESGKTAEEAGDDIYQGLIDALLEIPGVTAETVAQIVEMLKAGEYTVDYQITEEGLDELLRNLLEIPRDIDVNVWLNQQGEPPDEDDIFGNLFRGARRTVGGITLDRIRQVVESLLQTPEILAGALTGVNIPRVGVPRTPELDGGIGGREIHLHYNNTFPIHVDGLDDNDRIRAMVRNKLGPEIEDYLKRTGKTLEDLLR